MKKIILGFVIFLAALGPMLLAMGKTILIVKGLIATIALLKTAFTALTISLATNPFTALIAAAGIVIGALVGVRIWMDNVKKAAADREKLNLFGEEIEGLFNRMEARAGRGRKTLDMILDLQKNSMVSEKALVQHLSAMAEDYGFIISGNDEARIKQLMHINDLVKQTGNITLAAKMYNEELAKETAKTENLNTALVEKADLYKKLEGQYNAVVDNELEGIERERQASLAEAKEKITNAQELAQAQLFINQTADMKAETARADNLKKIKDDNTKAIEDRTELEKTGKLKLLEMQGDTVGLIKEQYAEDLKNFGDTEEKKAIIKAFYDKKIAETMAKEAKTTREKWEEAIDFVGNAFSQLGEVYMATTRAKITENDNWYAKEKESIEKSGLSAKKKEKKMEELDEKYNAKRTALQQEQAKKEKAIAVFESIIGTAAAFTKALPNIALAIIAGALGALKTAFIIAQPLPLAAGGLAKKRAGGIDAVIGEGREDELVLPMVTGVELLAAKLVKRLSSIIMPPLPALALAGGGGGGNHYSTEVNLYGNFVGNESAMKNFCREIDQRITTEYQRKGRQ
jgi:hypothetical protein